MKKSSAAKKQQAETMEYGGHLDILESQLAGGWLAGAGPTVADLYLGVLLRWAQLYPAAPPLSSLDGWPALHAQLAAGRGHGHRLRSEPRIE